MQDLNSTQSEGALKLIQCRAKQAAMQSMDHTAMQRHILVDVTITFIGADALPKMDVIGTADPYFVATIDDKIKLISTVQPNTLTPVWNEIWRVNNVPREGILKIVVWDKDDDTLSDDLIGTCQTQIFEGARELNLVSPTIKRTRGSISIKIDTTTPSALNLLPYTFNGPIVYSRHFSPTVGRLTKSLDDSGQRLYSTWKMRLKGIQTFFPGPLQHWNTSYSAAKRIFGSGPSSLAIRASIRAGHRLLYARSTRNAFGIIETKQDIIDIFTGGRDSSQRIKPTIYTYIISSEDDTFRFSETGAAFFVDFASKHALHANCSVNVRYSGEFHLRPQHGWDSLTEESDQMVQWEFVIDNNSGTYAPSKALLTDLKRLLEYNLPGFNIIALDRDDPELERSRETCRAYAVNVRKEQTSELQPHLHVEGEQSLNEQASLCGLPMGSQRKKNVDNATTTDFSDVS